MKRRTIARVIAAILFSYGMAFMLVSSHKSELAQYRTLSHDALLDSLASKQKTDFSSSFGESLLGIGVLVALIELMTSVIELAINRIVPLHPPGTSEPAVEHST
jgi:hypothetical protein